MINLSFSVENSFILYFTNIPLLFPYLLVQTDYINSHIRHTYTIFNHDK